MSGPFSLDGRSVVVTGGLGQLGRVYVRSLHDAGARVVALDQVASPDEGFDDLDPERLMFVGADVTQRTSLESALRVVVERWGVPHGLVNNAGIDSPPGASAAENGRFEGYPVDSWDQVMAVNAKGPFLCCQVFGGAMAWEGRGSIVNIASIYGLVSPDQRLYEYRAESGEPFFKPVAYSASKSAVLNLTRYLATYWAPQGVRVNTLSLGGVYNGQDERFLKGYESRVPLGRMADPREAAGPLLFLISDAASYVTGSNLVVDGGWTAW